MTLPRIRKLRTGASGGEQVDGMPAPAVVQSNPAHVRVGDGYAATHVVCGYPADVGPAWCDPLLSYPGRVDVALHVEPVPSQVAAPMLKSQRARLESTRRLDADSGRLGDPAVEAASVDAADLAERVARGAAKLFHTGLYVTAHGRDLDELATVNAGVRAAGASTLLDLQPATFRHQHGWASTLPLGVDELRMRRILDTDALAAVFPFASTDLPAPPPGHPGGVDAVLFGLSTTSRSVLMWNRWAQDNHNMVVLARSGAGKSYLVKLDVLRNLYHGVHVAVVDPEDEYVGVAEHVGGTVIRLGATGVRVNPLDIPSGWDTSLSAWCAHLHRFIAVLLGAPVGVDDGHVLDEALIHTYLSAGITSDPATWGRPAPLLRDLTDHLARQDTTGGRRLAGRLAPYATGSFSGLFDGPTSTVPYGHLVVWSLRNLPDEMRTVGIYLALSTIWNTINTTGRRRRTGAAAGGRRRGVAADA